VTSWRWLGVAAVVFLGVGGVAGGWPASYARLPGAFRVEAWERSTDQHNLDLASWVAKELPPGYGIASDFETANLLSSLGHDAAPSGIAALFLDPRFSPSARNLAREKRIDFVVVDQRMASSSPPMDPTLTTIPPRGGTGCQSQLKTLTNSTASRA